MSLTSSSRFVVKIADLVTVAIKEIDLGVFGKEPTKVRDL